MSLLEKAGIYSQERLSYLTAYKKIEEAGGVGWLIGEAGNLRFHGDQTALAVVVTTWPNDTFVRAQLHWGLERVDRRSWKSTWESQGVMLEASERTDVAVRFTQGDYWDYLRLLKETKTNDWGTNIAWYQTRVNLTETDLELLHKGGDGYSLQEQLAVAKKLAQPQSDYRYGEGDASKAAILRKDKHFRIIFPTDLSLIKNPIPYLNTRPASRG